MISSSQSSSDFILILDAEVIVRYLLDHRFEPLLIGEVNRLSDYKLPRILSLVDSGISPTS